LRRDTPRRLLKTRSRVTNGRKLFVKGDGSSAWARRWKDLVNIHIADKGGPDRVSALTCAGWSTLEVHRPMQVRPPMVG
jgi:hypothetical protein